MKRISRTYIIIGVILLSLLQGLSPSLAQKVGKEDYFYVLDTRQGLADNQVLQMLQLQDGRLAVRTQRGINIYDGRRFRFIPLPKDKAQRLAGYDGQTHLYTDAQDRLWIKDYHQVYCIDLKKNAALPRPFDNDSICDLFVDSKRNVWFVMGKMVVCASDGRSVQLKDSWGRLQDLDTDGEYVYTFHSLGTVAAFKNGKLAYTVSAYSPSEALYYQNTSLAVQTPSGQFYQIKTGYNVEKRTNTSVFLHFAPEHRKYSKIYACDYVLHTLNMSSDNQALVSTQQGYLMFDFKVGNTPREVKELALPDGKSLTTGINTVYRDREGAIWLGTYHDGLIYVSPMLGLFFTIDKPWWQSGWGIFSLIVLVMVVVVIFLNHRTRKARTEQQAAKALSEEFPTVEQEPEFVQTVRSLVELHLEESEYGVEQLAHDLCMERTGLYKKLTALTGTSPVAFIRNIRLQRAAALLKEGRLTVNEIAERTGFSSPSYFTKCFKKEFGVLPSEYK